MDESILRDEDLAKSLRQVRSQVREKSPSKARREALEQLEADLLYGNRDQDMLPDLRVSLEEANRLWQVREQAFTSRIPILGPLITWFRELWNRVSTKWYVLAILHQQVAFNSSVTRCLNNLHQYLTISTLGIVRRMDALFQAMEEERVALELRWRDEHHQQAATWQEAFQRAESRAEVFSQKLTQMDERFSQTLALMEEAVTALREREEENRRGYVLQRMWLERLMLRLEDQAESLRQEPVAPLELIAPLEDHDYFVFENAFRGPSRDVRANQEIYLPLFLDRQPVADIGCGRGEFLEMLKEHGVEAYGIEINEQMRLICQEKGLVVHLADAFAHLEDLANGSLGGIFAAHVVEHLPTARLSDFARLASRKLQPGAYLVAETPNPLCLYAMAQHFYADISHTRPLHPRSLALLFEMAGFSEVEIRYLHPVAEVDRLSQVPLWGESEEREAAQAIQQNFARLNDLIYGYQDYAIVARK